MESARDASEPLLQKGSVLPLIVVALTAIIAMGGLAIDLGHVYVNRTRLQNAVDAAALSAAREFELRGENTSSTVRTNATNAATTAFNNILTSNPDNTRTVSAPTVTFATALAGPYSGSASPAHFVRVSASASLPPWFTRIVRNADLTMDASAVSGTLLSNMICGATPLAFCGGASAYTVGNVYTIAISQANSTTLGSGYYVNWYLDCGNGASCIRQRMANTPPDYCIQVGQSTAIDIKPGQNSGPNSQGLNTRFGEYKGGLTAADGPADTNITEGIRYSNYLDSPNNGRRRIDIAVADCSNSSKTATITKLASFFVINKANNQGSVTGEFIGLNSGTSCEGYCGGRIVLQHKPDETQ